MWIAHVPYAQAGGRLKMLYDCIKGPDDNADAITLAHSLRPHSMEGHMARYKYVLHHASTATPKWFLEMIGVSTDGDILGLSPGNSDNPDDWSHR